MRRVLQGLANTCGRAGLGVAQAAPEEALRPFGLASASVTRADDGTLVAEFKSREGAERAVRTLHETALAGCDATLRLDHALAGAIDPAYVPFSRPLQGTTGADFRAAMRSVAQSTGLPWPVPATDLLSRIERGAALPGPLFAATGSEDIARAVIARARARDASQPLSAAAARALGYAVSSLGWRSWHDALAPGTAAELLFALSRLDVRVNSTNAGFLVSLERTIHEGDPRTLEPSQVASALRGILGLGWAGNHAPMAALADAALLKCGAMTDEELAGVLRSLGAVGVHPGPEILSEFLSRVRAAAAQKVKPGSKALPVDTFGSVEAFLDALVGVLEMEMVPPEQRGERGRAAMEACGQDPVRARAALAAEGAHLEGITKVWGLANQLLADGAGVSSSQAALVSLHWVVATGAALREAHERGLSSLDRGMFSHGQWWMRAPGQWVKSSARLWWGYKSMADAMKAFEVGVSLATRRQAEETWLKWWGDRSMRMPTEDAARQREARQSYRALLTAATHLLKQSFPDAADGALTVTGGLDSGAGCVQQRSPFTANRDQRFDIVPRTGDKAPVPLDIVVLGAEGTAYEGVRAAVEPDIPHRDCLPRWPSRTLGRFTWHPLGRRVLRCVQLEARGYRPLRLDAALFRTGHESARRDAVREALRAAVKESMEGAGRFAEAEAVGTYVGAMHSSTVDLDPFGPGGRRHPLYKPKYRRPTYNDHNSWRRHLRDR
ncbi:unnamed protein product [Pedinophyceae sp. YPF-701]|nr:unnamed protein product [Pedinophyceae sp. YPF-701]